MDNVSGITIHVYKVHTWQIISLISSMSNCGIHQWFSRVLSRDNNRPRYACPFQYQSPCQSPCPCPMKNQFIRKSEVLFRLHQFPYPYPNQCHPIPVRSVSIGPSTVKNWYGRPILSISGPETCAVAMHSGILVYFSRERTPPRSWQSNLWCIQQSLHW